MSSDHPYQATACLFQSTRSVITKCDGYYKVRQKIPPSAKRSSLRPTIAIFLAVPTKENLKYFDQDYSANFTVNRNSAWRHCPSPTPNHERQTTTPGTTYENFFTRLISFIFIAKMGDGFVCKIYNSGVLCKCNKPIWQRSFNKPSQAIC